jgi:hypothetical protein
MHVQHGTFESTFEDYQFITISVECLIQGLFCAGAGMITFGALLGKASPTQLVLILLMEVPVYAVNAEMLVGGLFGKMGAQVRILLLSRPKMTSFQMFSKLSA